MILGFMEIPDLARGLRDEGRISAPLQGVTALLRDGHCSVTPLCIMRVPERAPMETAQDSMVCRADSAMKPSNGADAGGQETRCLRTM